MFFEPGQNIAIQGAAPGLELLMLVISILGSAEFYLAVIPAILWCHDRSLGLRLLLLISLSAAANALLKLLFHSPRPYWISPDVRAFTAEPSFGMPSGAAQISLTFLGYIGAQCRKLRIWAACILIVLLVALSRLYLGVHFTGDILCGWAAALIILLLFLRYESPVAGRVLRLALPLRIFLAFSVSIFLILAALPVFASYGGWEVPAGWSLTALEQAGEAISPLSLRDLIMAAGILFGAGAGAAFCAESLPYRVDGPLPQKAMRYVSGILVLAVFWVLLSALTKTPDLAGYAMTYLRAALAGLWITAGAPALFLRIGLARPAER